MRALTEKKLRRLLAADDRTQAIPRPARMSLTDWLLFDLVLVHQNIDLIGLENLQGSKDPEALVELFELVKRFNIEGLSGDMLAEAWSSATLYYNNQGHQCSPMLLQRRWYQLKEVTRTKFYDFWYAYRGAAKRLGLAEPHTPTPLQTAIAKKYKMLVTSPFLEWDELIARRLVTLPEEFERKMIERSMQRVIVRKPVEGGPDLEIIEPSVETIDLRRESDENENDDNNQQLERAQSPAVKIKEEPQDMDMDIGETEIERPKKSIYDVVLESTDIENEKLDSMDAEEPVDDEPMDDEMFTEEREIEETIVTTLKEQENSVLPQITSVFGNVSDTSALGNVDDDDDATVLENSVAKETSEHDDVNDINTDVSTTVGETSDGNANETSCTDNVDVNARGNEIDSVLSGNNDNEKEADICDVNEHGKVKDTSASGDNTKVCDSYAIDNVNDSSKVDVATEYLTNVDGSKDPKVADNVEDVQIIENISAPVVIPDSDEEENDENSDDIIDDIFLPAHTEPMDIDKFSFSKPLTLNNVSENTLKDEDSLEKKPDVTSFCFGQLPTDISFADDGIEFVDDGIMYVDEDTNTESKIKTEDDDSPKIDAKLLMCPIIYTTRLDDMALPQFTHVNDKLLLDTIATKSKPIKDEPVSDTNIPSDDNDLDEDEIPDTKKVKASSYLLQKPRSRTYNPIQLCKNPDFNTRLKRLTVGFFSSPRNRGLIKSCKPLTIDVSKAFESKLISGTLYLKPSDVNIKTKVVDDTESRQSVTVVPSALPAQSLIDNTKIPDIPSMPSQLESHQRNPDVGSTSERNKVINLPDISEIRRINQQLLTAEVTPIQVRNSQPQVPVTIVTHLNTPTGPAQKTLTIAKPDEVLLNESADARGPPKCVVITEDSPVKTNFDQNVSLRRDVCGTFIPNTQIGRPPKMINGKRMFPQKAVQQLPWKHRQSRTQIPWLSKNNDLAANNKKIEDTLLTLDTLNKMLYLLTEKEEPVVVPKKTKPKKTRKIVNKQQNNQKSGNNSCTGDNNSKGNLSEEAKKNCKLKINIKAAANLHNLNTQHDKHGKKSLNITKSTEIKEKTSGPHENYCCWCRQRMLQLLFSRKTIVPHECLDDHCTCCCQNLLKDYVAHVVTKRKPHGSAAVKPDDAANENVITYTSTTIHSNGKEAGEDQYQVPVKVVIELPPKFVSPIHVEPLTKSKTQNVISIDASDTSGFVPAVTVSGEGGAVTTPVVPPIVVRGIETPVSVSSGDSRLALKSHPYRLSHSISSDSHNKSTSLSNTPNPSIKDLQGSISSPTYKKYAAAKKVIVPNVLQRKNTTPPNVTTPKKVKEKMIFLNSKQISEKPTEFPIFLGKNKILLTTVKFPPNLKQFEESKMALAPSLNLPKGVQLIYLPNGTISYIIDKNVAVNAPDLANMPAIIEVVKTHMSLNTPSVSMDIQSQSSVTDGEVVNLIDDDDDVTATPSIEDNKNNESSLATELSSEQTTKESQTTSDNICIDSTNVQAEKSTEIEENPVDSIIDDKALDTPTEDNLNAYADQYTVTDMQEGKIQELSHSVVSLPSAELAQDKPNISSPIEHDQLESTSQNINAEIQDTLVEQDNPEASIKNDIAEVNNQAEASSQGESTDTQKIDQVTDQSEPQSKIVTEVDSTSEPSRNKSKNILSDLMEMSGIFDDDMTTAPEEAVPVQPEQHIALQESSCATSVQEQPELTQVSEDASAPQLPTIRLQPGLQVNTVKPISSLVKSPIGELSPITSLYELKYACLNKGIFFKLDFTTGFLAPINVCMKQNPKPVAPSQSLTNIAPKSVIDLTEDDDTGNKAADENKTEPLISPSKTSLLISNNLTTATSKLVTAIDTNQWTVKPVKLYKALKPSILRRLNEARIKKKILAEQNSMNAKQDHLRKRKQVLKTGDNVKQTPPVKEIATTTLSDDSSDEEPLANLVKRRKENEKAPEKEKEKDNEPEVSKEIELEMLEANDDVDIETVENDLATTETLIEVDINQGNEEEEEHCILGV